MKNGLLLGFLLGIWLTTTMLAEENIVGIGVSLGTDSSTGEIKIIQVVPGGPAYQAGVKAGLLLRKVDGVDMVGKKIADCVLLIRGPIGSKVNLEVFDPADKTTKQFALARDQIILKAAERAKRGDPAAPLKIKEWIKGGPVNVNDGKNVYVVEFWATWCPPCRVSIPHLTELQKRFKDKGVMIVGISDESPEKVKAFVTKMDDKMDYAVACDEDRQTFGQYMEAYRHDGIPTAFVVDRNGAVVWDGHPMAGLDKAIEATLEGKGDRKPEAGIK